MMINQITPNDQQMSVYSTDSAAQQTGTRGQR